MEEDHALSFAVERRFAETQGDLGGLFLTIYDYAWAEADDPEDEPIPEIINEAFGLFKTEAKFLVAHFEAAQEEIKKRLGEENFLVIELAIRILAKYRDFELIRQIRKSHQFGHCFQFVLC